MSLWSRLSSLRQSTFKESLHDVPDVTRTSRLCVALLGATCSSRPGADDAKAESRRRRCRLKGRARRADKKLDRSHRRRDRAKPGKPVSFMRDVAPILVENCIACHNPRKSESKYVMTTFAQLAKGGQQGEGITLEPGKPDESRFVELIRPDGQPRMPFKQDPLPTEKIALIERWVAEGAKYDGNSPGEDWTILLRKTQQVTIPAAYPVTVPITALAVQPRWVGDRGVGLS